MLEKFKNLLSNLKPCIISILFAFFFLKVLFFNSTFPQDYLFFRSEDIYWLLKMGEGILNTGQIPHFNVIGEFAVLKQISWTCYQWLFSVIMALINKFLGFHGLIYIYTVFYLFTICLLAYTVYLRGFRLFPEILVSISIASLFLYSILDLRPGIFSVIGCAILAIIFPYLEKKRYLRFVVPFLFLLWANLHLGFVFGILWLAVELAILSFLKKVIWPLWVFIASFLATGVNPNGFYLYKYLYILGKGSYMNTHILELRPFDFANEYAASVYMVLLLLSFIYTLKSRRIRLSEKVMFIVSAVLVFASLRHLSYIIVFMPIIYSAAIEKLNNTFLKESKIFQNQDKQKFKLPLYFVIYAFMGLILCLNKIYPIPQIPKYVTPEFITYLKKNPVYYPVLSRAEVGGELLYYTKLRSFLDTRFDMYGDDYVKKYVGLYSLEGNWNENFEKNNVKYVLYDYKIPYENPKAPLFIYIKKNFKSYGWKVLYEDKKLLFLGR